MNWRNDGTGLIDILIDGKVVAQSYMNYDGFKTTNAAGQPPGLILMIGNQAISSFSPGASTAIDNDGIPDGWTEAIQEVSIWNGKILNVDSLGATP